LSKRSKIIISLATVVLSIVSLVYVSRHFDRPNSAAASVPLALSPGHFSRDFTPDYSLKHKIAIEFDEPRNIQFSKSDCVTARHFPAGECNGIPTRFQGAWTLTSRGNTVAKGTIAPIMREGPFSAVLGSFKAQQRVPYRLDLEILTDGTRFTSAKPPLSVAVFVPEFAETITEAGLNILAGEIRVFFRNWLRSTSAHRGGVGFQRSER
jgi:hypothetical protein